MSLVTVTEISAKAWLRANGYRDLLRSVEAFENREKAAGRGTRIDWFLILAGTPSGEPRTRKGTTFPMVQAFRRRQGYPLANEALQRSPLEVAPPIRKQEERWGKRFRRATH